MLATVHSAASVGGVPSGETGIYGGLPDPSNPFCNFISEFLRTWPIERIYRHERPENGNDNGFAGRRRGRRGFWHKDQKRDSLAVGEPDRGADAELGGDPGGDPAARSQGLRSFRDDLGDS